MEIHRRLMYTCDERVFNTKIFTTFLFKWKCTLTTSYQHICEPLKRWTHCVSVSHLIISYATINNGIYFAKKRNTTEIARETRQLLLEYYYYYFCLEGGNYSQFDEICWVLFNLIQWKNSKNIAMEVNFYNF